jgi:hypothetical protein
MGFLAPCLRIQKFRSRRARLTTVLAKEGLSYARGGYIHGANLTGPSKSLGERLKVNSIQVVETEFDRAYRSIESDPPAALTSACAILEAVCKHYIQAEYLPMPGKQTLGTLWSEVSKHLGLSPAQLARRRHETDPVGPFQHSKWYRGASNSRRLCARFMGTRRTRLRRVMLGSRFMRLTR